MEAASGLVSVPCGWRMRTCFRSAAHASTIGRLPKTLGQLAKSRLLHTPLQPWDQWFEALGVAAPPARRGMTFAETDILLRAAIAGLGIALRAACWHSLNWMLAGWSDRCRMRYVLIGHITSFIPTRSNRRRVCWFFATGCWSRRGR